MSKIKMTAEIREQLTGLLPMKNDAEYRFTPSIFDNVPEEYKPTFSIHQLNNEQVLEVKGMLYEEATTSDKKRTKQKLQAELKRKGDDYMAILKKVVVGWDNLYIINGEEAELFEYSHDVIDDLPEVIRTELFSEAIKISGFLPKDIV